MIVSENICPVCKHHNELEAIFCANCGAAMENPFMDSGTRTQKTNMAVAPESIKDWSIKDAEIPDSGIGVYIAGNLQPSFTDSKREIVIGRRTGKTSKVSDALFDLAPFGGYGQGVSRRHVVIQQTDHGYEVLDLGSVNGTWLNGERLVPHKAYPLASGARLKLGSMRLLVLYRTPAENK